MLERRTDAAVEPPQLGTVEARCRAEWVELRPPQGLVGVDVPHPGKCALVEERSLEGRAPAGEAHAEAGGREERVERLVADARSEVRLRLPRLEQEPRAEAPDITVSDVRSVV